MAPVVPSLSRDANGLVDLGEVVDKYDVIGVSDGAVIVSLRDTVYTQPSLAEYGSTGSSSYGSIFRQEYNASLRGYLGLRKYDEMRRSDGTVRGILRLVKTPILAARWYIEPASQDRKKDKVIADFVWDCLTKYQSMSFPQMLTEALLMIEFGYYCFEKVYEKRTVKGKQRIVWKKLAPRHPMDVYDWNYDANGGPVSLEMYPPDGAHVQGNDTITIPIDKLLVFSYDKEAGNIEGISALRSAYKHWFYKENLYKIDAIQKERHGIGIPVITLPPNFNDQDKRLADEMGRNLRTNEKAHVILPPNWELLFAKLEGQPVNALESAEHHDLEIAKNLLGQFLNYDLRGATDESSQTLFLKSTRFVAETIRDTFNKYAIPQLVDFNFPGVEDYPELRVRRIGDTVDWRTISFAIRNLIGSGVIIPDDPLEAYIRNEMDLPMADKSTERIIITPPDEGTIPDGQPDGRPGAGGPKADEAHQNGGAGALARPPSTGRQSTAKNSRQGKTPGNNGRVGNDKSGG